MITNDSLKDLQNKLSSLAVKIGEQNSINLDYSLNSVSEVDDILTKVHESYISTKDETGINGIALEFGAYLISVIEKNIGQGEWNRDSEEMGKDTFPYKLSNGNLIFPYSWCLKKIINGDEDNISKKFKVLVLKNN